jgi:hypothetical protein
VLVYRLLCWDLAGGDGLCCSRTACRLQVGRCSRLQMLRCDAHVKKCGALSVAEVRGCSWGYVGAMWLQLSCIRLSIGAGVSSAVLRSGWWCWSLLKPYSLPVASRPLQAPANVTLRCTRQEMWGAFGGRGACICSWECMLLHAGWCWCIRSCVQCWLVVLVSVRSSIQAAALDGPIMHAVIQLHVHAAVAGGAAATRRLVWSRFRLN